MKFLKKTINCGDVNSTFVGKKVVINGWVHRKREHGAITFLNIRDRYGIVQVIVEENAPKAVKDLIPSLKFEYCIAVEGVVRLRDKSLVNKDMKTGDVEIVASKIEVLSRCEVLPFQISDDKTQAKEDLRLKYRYLDLRSGSMQRHIAFRHEFIRAIREYLSDKGFFEIETPTLIRSTPEGARDFLVPSRLYPGKFYSLPQSPQLMKQLLMVSGFDKYFQVARCYRDEDARGDRQLEFTQLDIEMSFVERDDVLSLIEDMFSVVLKKTKGLKLPKHFTRLSYREAMDTYGSDKPDLRFGLKITDFSKYVEKSTFTPALDILKDKGFVRAIAVRKAELGDKKPDFSRKAIEKYAEVARVHKNDLFFYMKCESGTLSTGASKYFTDIASHIIKDYALEDGDLILVVADRKQKRACAQAGAVRNALAYDMNLADPNRFEFCWIVDFPLFSYNEEEGHWEAEHHMFSRPQDRFIDTLEKNPGEVLGDLYDLVLNGYEVASGSIRIHDIELQERVFEICNYSREDAQKAFGFLLDAFKFGPPPHGGIAPGVDRMCMILEGEDSIKEVIAFPKNTFAVSTMDDSPNTVTQRQLDELNIIIREPDKDCKKDNKSLDK